MIFYKIIAHNFKQYGPHTEILFPTEGLICIVGKNGKGKSTILETIAWVFYNRVRGTLNDDILNTKAHPKDDCFVELFFHFNGVDYIAKRHLTKTNECYIRTASGELFAQGKTNVTSYVIENLFRMDFEAFIACYYAEQFDFDNLVKLVPSKRVKTISKLLGIDAIDAAITLTRKQASTLMAEINTLRKFIENDSSLSIQKDSLNENLTVVSKNIKEIAERIDTVTSEYKNLLLKKSTLDQDYLKFNDIKNQIFTTKSQMDTLINRSLQPNTDALNKLLVQKERYDAISEYKALYPALNNEKEQMNDDRVKFQRKSFLSNELANAQNHLGNAMSFIDNLKEQLASFGDVSSSIQVEKEKLETIRVDGEKARSLSKETIFEIDSMKKYLSDINKTKDKFNLLGSDAPCPSCERPLGEHYEKKMEEINAEIEEVNKNIEEKNQLLNERDASIKELIEQFKTQDALLQSLSSKENEKRAVESKLSNALSNIETIKTTVLQYEQELATLNDIHFDETAYNELAKKVSDSRKLYDEIISIEGSIDKIPTLEATLEEVRAEIQNLSVFGENLLSELKALNFDEEFYRSLNQQAQTLNEQIDHLKSSKSQFEIETVGIKKDIDFITNKLEENKKHKSNITSLEKEISVKNFLEKAFSKFKTDILVKLSPTLSDFMSDYIDIMTNGKYNQVELDKDYNIFIYKDGLKHPLSFYSGGEQQLAALCLRLAITSLLVSQKGQAQFKMIAMDEVFGSMDNERQDNIVEMLRNLNEKFSQIIIVTHSESVKDSFDHLLEVSQDSNGFSKVKFLTDTDLSETESILDTYLLD